MKFEETERVSLAWVVRDAAEKFPATNGDRGVL